MKQFTKTTEDFICENCGHEVKGDGFTNHCPNCFYSKHVDINPGDRMCKCGGLMAPISVFEQRGELAILHKCKKCGFERKNRVADNDNKENLFKLMKEIAEKGSKSILENGFIFTVKQK